MGKIGLQLKANLENIKNLTVDGEDFRWFMKLRCNNCGEETEKWQYLTMNEKLPMKGSRGVANFVSKCKLCARENSIDIIKDSVKSYSAEDSSYQTVVGFECRGLEPLEFSPRDCFKAESTASNTKFSKISLQENDWVDYDEEGKVCVGVYDLEYRFVKM